MRKIFKRVYISCPSLIKILLTLLYDLYGDVYCKFKKTPNIKRSNGIENIKKKILFYHISGLSFGGTEKFLQIIAKYLDKNKYEVFFMYSSKNRKDFSKRTDGRASYLQNAEVHFLPFDYELFEEKYPYYIKGMRPHILNTINEKGIDLVITATDGHTEYPINLIKNIPIILINIFGAPTLQRNITKNICISNEVANKIRGIVSKEKIEVIYIPSEKPSENSVNKGLEIRKRLGINDSDIVFGRIGRADDSIFDQIGIEAFKKLVSKYSNAHYIIMSPPPVLINIVSEEKIPNVHFLPPSSNEEDIWAFHNSIDVLAHFRKDGESCGLNIAESMLCSKPIISHKSTIWNAHLEYLDFSFSRVAEINNVTQYASYMEEMLKFKKSDQLRQMGQMAKEKAENLFLIDNTIIKFDSLLKNLP